MMPEGNSPAGDSIRQLLSRHQNWLRQMSLRGRILISSRWLWLGAAVITIAVALLSEGRLLASNARGLDFCFFVWAGSLCGMLLDPIHRWRVERLPRLPQPLSAFDWLLVSVLYVLLVGAYGILKVLLAWPEVDALLAAALWLSMLYGIWLGRARVSA